MKAKETARKTEKVSRVKWGALIAGVLCANVLVAEVAAPPVTDGLFLHLDGSSAIVDSQGRIGTWTNLVTGAGVSGDFTQTIDTRKPTLSVAVNGLRTLNFKRSSNQCLAVAGDSAWDRGSGSEWTTFVVFAPNSISTDDTTRDLFCAGYQNCDGSATNVANAATAVRIFLHTTKGERYVTANGRDPSGAYIATRINADNMAVGRWEVVCGRWSSAAATIAIDRTNRVHAAKATGTNQQIADCLTNHIYTTIGAEINHAGGARNHYDGEIAAVLSDTETAQVQNWLADRYIRCGVIRPYESNLALHCRMDDKDTRRGTSKPPPALSTADGAWTTRSTTNNHAFTASGSCGVVVSSAAGMIGEGVSFEGVAGTESAPYRALTIPNASATALEPGTGNFTVSLWFNARNAVTNTFSITLAAHGNLNTSNKGWCINLGTSATPLPGDNYEYAPSSNITWRVCTSGYEGGSQSDDCKALFRVDGSDGITENGVWRHVALVVDRDEKQLCAYLDGVLRGASVIIDEAAIESGGEDLVIGGRPTVSARRSYDGLVDDFAIWHRALSRDEIARIYELGCMNQSFLARPSGGTCIAIR
jgi:hypothetical protein